MLKFAVVNANKNAQTGEFTKPDVTKFNSSNLNAIATDDDPHTVIPKGEAGKHFNAGELYVGNFDTDQDQFVDDLVAVPELTLNATPKGVKVDNGKITED